ncbi:MAG TPA: hypothetical protein CFH84_08860 [Sulfurimonas sp. UBA12504]|nr:MAG: hypothetical protein A2019_01100 [Sulfurimonas sp. GWF2_37_8]DAB29569.1 MAG TPA: hypothetical protein CFH84_08860 [Sulfurimonas sp. UBA12504]
MKHLTSLANGVALGGAGLVMMSVLSGCAQEEQKPANKFLVIEQQPNGKYLVVEEVPTDGPSRAVIREKDANGNTVERFMNEAEMKTLAEQEYLKTQDGTSETVQSGESSGGMGLAGTILAVAAGSLLGNMIGNALMNNKNFSQKATSVNQSPYARSAAKSSATSGKKSFFGSSSSSNSASKTNFGS